MLKPLLHRLRALRWRRVIALALVIASGSMALAWHHFQVEREYHALWMLLGRARTLAMAFGPVNVRFTDHGVVVENRDGAVLESLVLVTLGEVRYRTLRGDRRIVFGPSGPTGPYNIYLHGGDVTLRAWTGLERSLWVHCTGGITQGRNDDWTLNRR